MSRGRPTAALAISALAAAHLGATAAFLGLRGEHLLGDALLVALALAGPRARRFALLALPLWLTGVVYDFGRFLMPLRGPVHVADLHAAELLWFGVPTADGPVTPAAFLQPLASAPLDLVCGLAYILYLFVPIALAVGWFLRGDEARAARLTWAFLLVNLAGYVTQLVYPAAPPWYVDRYGLGPAVLDAAPSAAGAARFDALLGVEYFRGWYARSANVFGAMPSLHTAVPVVAAYTAVGLGARRVLPLAAFALLVAFAAVYLNHHYVLDVVAGAAYGVAAAAVVSLAVRGAVRPARPETTEVSTAVTP